MFINQQEDSHRDMCRSKMNGIKFAHNKCAKIINIT